MCYAKPGPRCSRHAFQNLEKAKQSHDTRTILLARDEYDETRAGQKELEQLIVRAHKNKKSTAELKSRMLTGQYRYEYKKSLYNELTKETKKSNIISMNNLTSVAVMKGSNLLDAAQHVKITTMQDAQACLASYYGSTLGDICQHKKINVVDNALDKGQAGIVIEQILGITANQEQAPDLLDGDIKCGQVKYSPVFGAHIPSQTTKVTMYSPLNLVTTPVLQSVMMAKAKSFHVSLLKGVSTSESILLSTHILDVDKIPALKTLLEKDYDDFARQVKNSPCAKNIINGKEVYTITSISSSQGEAMQIRTAGQGRGEVASCVDLQGVLGPVGRTYVWKPRAFYLRRPMTTMFALIEQGKLTHQQANTLALMPGVMKSMLKFKKAYVELMAIES